MRLNWWRWADAVVPDEVRSFRDHVLKVGEGQLVVSVQVGLLHGLVTHQHHLLRRQVSFGQLVEGFLQVFLTDEAVPVIVWATRGTRQQKEGANGQQGHKVTVKVWKDRSITVDLKGIDHLQLSRRCFTERRKHVHKVIEALVPLSVFRERLHNPLSERVLLEHSRKTNR